MADRPAAPNIPLLINNTIDPDALNGGPLKTYAKYDNPAFGDFLFPSWLGLDESGAPVDVTDIVIEVDPANEEPLGFLMSITNEFVMKLNKGQVFYSFRLQRTGDTAKLESRRIHFGIGKESWLSGPQIKESHDLQLDSEFPGSTGPNFTVAVVPYGVMSNGDVVKLFMQGRYADGTESRLKAYPPKTLSSTDTDTTNNPGQTLSWQVSQLDAVLLEGGEMDFYYTITYASSPQVETRSAVRTFIVVPPVAAELEAANVKNLTGTVINPALFPNGIVVVVKPWPGIRIGDDLLVYGTRTGSGANPNRNTISYLKIDITHIDSGRIEVPIAGQWLTDNLGGNVALRYQYARADAGGSGMTLALTIAQPLELPPPTVDNSVFTAGRDELPPLSAVGGAFIAIPVEATIGDGSTVTAYWRGFGESGSCEVQEPSQSSPLKFKVPASVIPPNMGKIVEVTYSVDGQFSDPSLSLFIRPLTSHPLITCEKVQIGSPATLKLSDIPSEGLVVTIERWSFMAAGQAVRLWLTTTDITARDIIPKRPVIVAEINTGVKGRLMKADLAGIAENVTFTLRASVSFDDGNSDTLFNRPLVIKLLA